MNTTFLTDDRGGVLAEYGILIAILVLGLVAVMATFKSQFTTWFGGISTSVSQIGQ